MKTNPVSRKNFWNWYVVGTAVFILAVFAEYIILADTMLQEGKLFRNCFLFTLFSSVAFGYPYSKKYMRTKAAAVFVAALCPAVLFQILYYGICTLPGEVALFRGCFLAIGFVFIAYKAWNYEAILSVMLASHVRSCLRMPMFTVQRKYSLQNKHNQWEQALQRAGIEKLSVKGWSTMSHDEKVNYVHRLLLAEQNVSCYGIYPLIHLQFRSGKADLDFEYFPEKGLIYWDERMVDQYPLVSIVEVLFLRLQEFHWYQKLDVEYKKILKRKQRQLHIELVLYWNFLLYETLFAKRDSESYDLITGHYAKHKAEWLCGLL